LVSLLGANCGGESGGGSGGESSGTGASSGNPDPECVAGDTRECSGPGACQGAQECNEDRTGWTTCDCGSATGGTAGDGGSGGDGATTGSGGDGATTGNGGASGGRGATGGNGGSGATGGSITLPGTGSTSTGGNGEPVYCQSATVNFEPQVPTVYVLVDQSGSIYDLQQWVPLRDAVLPVIQSLQADVRFGFGTYTGTQAACTGLSDMGTIGLNNYDAIAAYYNGLPTTSLANQETPTAKAVQQVVDVLKADDTVPGSRSIFLVTADDDNDFCNNPNPECGSDALIRVMQDAAAAGIKTFIFALDNQGIGNKDWLDFWAQAGQGQKPNWALAQSITQYNGMLYDGCKPWPDWMQYWTASAHAEFYPAGDYSPQGGTAKAFLNASTAAVAQEIGKQVETLKSCLFDLSSGESAGGIVEGVKPGASGHIKVGGEEIPADQWRMNSETELELLGAACDKWKDPNVTELFAGFDCDDLIIIIE
jgi:hypothetical protein